MTEPNPQAPSGPGLSTVAAALQRHLSFDPAPPLTVTTAWSPYTETHRFWLATYRELPGMRRAQQSILGEPFKAASSHTQWTVEGLEGTWPDLPGTLAAIQQALSGGPAPAPDPLPDAPAATAGEPIAAEAIAAEAAPLQPPTQHEAPPSAPAAAPARLPAADGPASPPQLSLFG